MHARVAGADKFQAKKILQASNAKTGREFFFGSCLGIATDNGVGMPRQSNGPLFDVDGLCSHHFHSSLFALADDEEFLFNNPSTFVLNAPVSFLQRV